MKKTTLLSEQELVRGEKENDSSSRSGSPEHAGRSQLIKKVLVAAAAVAALGGAIWGIGAIAKQTQPDLPDQIPDTTLVTWDPDVPRPIPALTGVIGGPMLDNDCGDYTPPVDNGSRTVQSTLSNRYAGQSIPGFYGDVSVVDVRSYDLSNTGFRAYEPEIRLERKPDRIGYIDFDYPGSRLSEPVTDVVDRVYLLSVLQDTEYTPETHLHEDTDSCIKLYVGDEVCSIYPDNTVVCDRGVGKCDFLHISALAWKYDTQVVEDYFRFLAFYSRVDRGTDGTETQVRPAEEHYKLCITGPGLHMDLDREAAEQLFRTVLDLPLSIGELNQRDLYLTTDIPAEETKFHGLCNFAYAVIAPIDWEPAGTPICLTEYLKGEPTWFVGYKSEVQDYFQQYIDDETHTPYHQYWFYPDGTIAVITGVYQGRFGKYQMYEREEELTLLWTEKIEPQWPRPSICPNAFDWNTLIAELEKLAGQNGSDQ